MVLNTKLLSVKITFKKVKNNLDTNTWRGL